MTQDRADIASLEKRLAEARRELETLEKRNAMLLNAAPFGIAVLHPNGSALTNPVADALFGLAPEAPADAPDAWQEQYGFFDEDRRTRVNVHELPGVRAMGGQKVERQRLWVVPPDGSGGVMIEMTATPLPEHASVTILRDVTARARLEEELLERRASLEERDAENRELIERLRVALDALATPVLEVDQGVLVAPIVGLVDTQRATQISEHLLHEVVRQQADWVVIDATGVEVVDTATAAALARIVSAVELLGSRCVASGLSGAVVQTLVDLGVDLGRLETHQSLRQALERCAAMRDGERRARRSRASEVSR